MSHNYETDKQHLAMLLQTNVQYIGVLGPRSRSTRMITELGLGVERELDHRFMYFI